MADRDSGSLNFNKLICELEKTIDLGPEPRELRLGDSFSDNSNMAFHTFRYDFKPASVDAKQMATVEIGPGNQTTVQVPNVEGSGMSHTVFKGPCKPYMKECVLIIDHATGDIVLERLTSNVQLKKTRADVNAKIQHRTPTSVEQASSSRKVSPYQSSPNNLYLKSPVNQSSPNNLYLKSPSIQSSPNNLYLKSPANQCSPSMSSFIPPTGLAKPVSFINSMPLLSSDIATSPIEVTGEASEAGYLSDNSNDSNSSESSDSESDQNESIIVPSRNVDITTPSSFPPSMPYFNELNLLNDDVSELNQLNEDLQLSESESDG